MKIEMRKFRIGTLAEKLNVERFVIRFWEKEFNIKPHRSDGQQRFYTEKDFEKFAAIKELLYDKGYTIAGAKKLLKKGYKRALSGTDKQDIVASQVTTMEPEMHVESSDIKKQSSDLTMQILELQKKLIKLRELL